MLDIETETSSFNILILDDNASTRNIAKKVLEQNLDCEVRLCTNASDLNGLATQSKPDLFLLDVDLEKGSSLEICNRLKENPDTNQIPIVFLSSYDSPSKRVAALNAGGVDYLDKPFYPEELIKRIKTHIEVHRLQIAIMNQLNEQRALLRVLCHDLVNPLFAAQGLLSLRIEKGTVDTEVATRALNCCNSAMELITHVRNEHSLVSKNKQFAEEIVSVAEAFNESAKTLQNRYNKKEVQLEVKADPRARLSINRIVLVHNILNNLLTNALKFSYSKSKVSLEARVDEKNRCVIEVVDSGIGMPPEILENIFQENAKVSRQGTSSEKGTGFGMPLVKRYVEKSSGKIEVESTERIQSENGLSSGGTTVRLTFANQS